MDLTETIVREQKALCATHGANWCESPVTSKIGIARNVKEGLLPINGLRHPPQGDTTGWYIWGGDELSAEPDFFLPLHVGHLEEWCPLVLEFLGLPPGWRFLTDGDYKDVWFDEGLLL